MIHVIDVQSRATIQDLGRLVYVDLESVIVGQWTN